jgi:hypothetical protein
MFRFFPIADAARFHVDEQTFIFAPILAGLILRSREAASRTREDG